MGPAAASFIALNNNGRYDYPPQVFDEIEQDNLNDYYKAARTINSSAYLHAREALTRGRGRLVNAKDLAAMSAAVLHLVENPGRDKPWRKGLCPWSPDVMA